MFVQGLFRKSLLWIGLLIIVQTVSAGDTPNRGAVVVLTDSNYSAATDDFARDVFIKFYAPWCPHCKRIKKTWESLARSYKGEDVIIAEVDATKEMALKGRFDIKHYPTILLIKNGRVYEFKSFRALTVLLKFLDKDFAAADGVPLPPALTDAEYKEYKKKEDAKAARKKTRLAARRAAKKKAEAEAKAARQGHAKLGDAAAQRADDLIQALENKSGKPLIRSPEAIADVKAVESKKKKHNQKGPTIEIKTDTSTTKHGDGDTNLKLEELKNLLEKLGESDEGKKLLQDIKKD